MREAHKTTSVSRLPLRMFPHKLQEIFPEINCRKFFFRNSGGINFCELGFTQDFAGINFRELSLTKDFAGINFRESALFKAFTVVNLTFALGNIFSTTLVYGLENDLSTN